MARIRTVKPALFKHVELFDLEASTKLPVRLAFIGLFTACDREGRFKWRPRELKLDVLPHDDVDFSAILDALAGAGFIVKYTSGGKEYGYIPTWADHQKPNKRESASTIPAPSQDTCTHVHAHADTLTHVGNREGNREGVPHVPCNSQPEKSEIQASDGELWGIAKLHPGNSRYRNETELPPEQLRLLVRAVEADGAEVVRKGTAAFRQKWDTMPEEERKFLPGEHKRPIEFFRTFAYRDFKEKPQANPMAGYKDGRLLAQQIVEQRRKAQQANA